MRGAWKSRLSDFLRSCRIPLDSKSRETILKLLIVAMIMLSAGPELVPALELRILLELLGATLFMTAYAVGARFAVWSLGQNLRGLLLAVAPTALMVVAFWDLWLGTVAAMVASIHGLGRLFA